MRKRTNYGLWTPRLDDALRLLFPTYPSWHVASIMGKTLSSVNCRANLLGLKKHPEYLREIQAYTTKHLMEGTAYRFAKGHTPKNKGRKMPPELRAKCQHTFFKKGQKPKNTKWNGYERLSADGYIEVRVSEKRFIGKHRLLWEQHNGQIPAGMAIIFADGDRTNFAIENLVCVSRGDLVILNKNKRYGREIAESALLLSKIKNQLTLKTKKS